MEIHQLVIFLKVAKYKSFTKAAEEIYLSQSTVSNHIQNLETFFEQKIFDRLGKEVVLTYFGERLYEWAQKIIDLHEQALWQLKELPSELNGNLHIAASTMPCQYIVPQLLSKFAEQHPHVCYHLKQFPSKTVFQEIVKGSYDIGFVGDRYASERIDYIPLLDEQLVLISPNKIELPKEVSIKHLVKYPFIMRKPESGTQSVLEKRLKEYGFPMTQLTVIAYLDSLQSVIQAVDAGLGIAFISEVAARDIEGKSIRVNYISELQEKRTFYMIFNKYKTMSPITHEFIEAVRRGYEYSRI
jgi:DNA-binding transcriptional LysR family regulator